MVANTDWGADKTVLLRLYRSLIRSRLDYGSAVSGSARQSYIQMLDPIQNQALRICLGAFKTSPAESLRVEANEPSLYHRREQLAVQYATKVLASPNNPVKQMITDPEYEALFNEKENTIPTFAMRIKPHLGALGFNRKKISDLGYPKIPPWTAHRAEVNR